MKEVWLGSESDQHYIQVYLENIRKLDPIEITTVPNPIHLSSSFIEEVLDVQLFWEIVTWCIEECKKCYSIHLSVINPQRYYVGRTQKEYELGGFHSKLGLGYQYWYHAGFVVALNKVLISKKLRTLELARGFLNDCFHHSTFRSFRRAIRLPTSSMDIAKHRVPEIYREQYGINFRNQDGYSYSSPGLTARSPETINLNVLMDGVIVMVVAELVKEYMGVSKIYSENGLEEETWKEIFLEPFDQKILVRADDFHKSVTVPSRLFIEHWGGKRLVQIILNSMMNGVTEPLEHYFDEKTGESNTWEKKFKNPDFCLLVNSIG